MSFFQNVFYPNIVCHSSQKDFMIGMVEARLGITLLSSRVAEEIINPKIKAIPLINFKARLELTMITKKAKYIPYTVKEFITITEQILQREELE
ncbi:LysR substrate-binding domain-containing protein [Bacillus carboniphilus]|uniref:LysR substrate-binding domain-containing protein n=1 Tax=Bacillus carboniphilus TaxID=86663 RepID=A0ABY9JUB6_9BACI|nr:LysR substrate-binding domain-containing protein [Bacillus carboniphilus]WLR42338.1 LysR substrate-binding domain-containing protein [Bacillus carboniphilus]